MQEAADAADIGSMIGGLVGGSGVNPAQPAGQYFNQIPGMLNKTYQPWMQGGQQAFQNAGNQFYQAASNPAGVMNQMGSTYHQSPGYQWQMGQALEGMNKAAAAGGMAGSPMEQQQMGTVATGLANQDYYNYLHNVMGIYGQGLQGEMGQSEIGADMANNYGTNYGQALEGQANLAYAGQQNQNQANAGKSAGFGALAGLAAVALM